MTNKMIFFFFYVDVGLFLEAESNKYVCDFTHFFNPFKKILCEKEMNVNKWVGTTEHKKQMAHNRKGKVFFL